MTTTNVPPSKQAAPVFHWPRCPEADRYIRGQIKSFLKGHLFAFRLAARMKAETSTEFLVWVDHLVLPWVEKNVKQITSLGFIREKNPKVPSGSVAFWHPRGQFPRLLLSKGVSRVSCFIAVDDISQFQVVHGLNECIEGAPLAPYRSMSLTQGDHTLGVVERRGTRDLVPHETSMADIYLRHLEGWVTRRRRFVNDGEGLRETLTLAQRMVRALPVGVAASCFLEAERRYWQSRNRAGQIQKARQDKLGLGWANHDHHTFRSSRLAFPLLVKVLETFGFEKRERFYAGEEAGWGAQVMEQNEAGLVIFADVDLTPEDARLDFSKEPLTPLQRPGTVGLWCGLHGESILQAGMHHLEAQFDFDHLRAALNGQKIPMMAPFTNFSYLRQAFTQGELWPVSQNRLTKLKEKGALSKEACRLIRQRGAVGSHLENLQRREGFKGFHQKGVSHIIRAVNPERQALRRKGRG